MKHAKNGDGFRISKLDEFDHHRLVLFLNNQSIGLHGFIAIYRGNSTKPAFGATRLWYYSSETDALKDALKLSKTMTYKAAFANLPYGGGKAVLSITKHFHSKGLLLKEYAKYVNYLDGHFITGADVGVSHAGLLAMASQSKYIVGIKSDPVKFTALGILYAIHACLKEIESDESIKGKTFAIQGLGKTGKELLRHIYKDAEKIYVSDINGNSVKAVVRQFPRVISVSPSEIHKQKVDVFSPCALGGIINSKNIQSFHCKIIAGSANNQLEKESLGESLYKKGVLYAPDYVINAGGLICVIDEHENHNHSEQRVAKKVAKIKGRLQEVIKKSKQTNKPTNIIADEIAEKSMVNLVW